MEWSEFSCGGNKADKRQELTGGNSLHLTQQWMELNDDEFKNVQISTFATLSIWLMLLFLFVCNDYLISVM